MKNNWRQRDVEIFEIEGDLENVKTIGKPFAGGKAIETIEPRESFKRAIAIFPRLYIYD